MKSAHLLTIIFIIGLTASFSAAQIKTASIAKEDSVEQIILTAQNHLDQGDAAGASSILQTALLKNPKNNLIKFWLGKVFYSRGNYQLAIENLSVVADKLPKNSGEQVQSIQMLGLAYYISGRLAEAIFDQLPGTVW